MKIGYNNVVWLSEKGNIAISSCAGIYFVSVKVFYGETYLWRWIETFEKQSDAINFSCKIKDVPLIER